jgi:hypothetical protein
VQRNKAPDFRQYFGAEARSVENAVMAGSRLQAVLPQRHGQIFAQIMCSERLANPRDVVLFALYGHERHPADLAWIDEAPTVAHLAIGKRMVEKDCLDRLQVILPRQIHHGQELVIEFPMLISGIAIASDQIVK